MTSLATTTSNSARLYRHALLWWLVLFAFAFANGALREIALRPLLGPDALPTSGLTGLLLLTIAIWLFVRRHAGLALRDAAPIGLLWLALTLAAEALLLVATGRPITDVTGFFTVAALARGDLFAPIVLWVAVAPALFCRLRH